MGTVNTTSAYTGSNAPTTADLKQLKHDSQHDPSAVAADLAKLSSDWAAAGFSADALGQRVDSYLNGGAHPTDAAHIATVDQMLASGPQPQDDDGFANALGTSDTATTQPAASTYSGNIQQSGTGWTGDVNVASTSANYQGLTLDQLMAGNSGIAQALQAHPDIVAAIRKVSSETGAPDGLLAGVIYQESGFDVNSTSDNPDPTSGDSQDLGLCQCPNGDFSGDEWKDPYTNINTFVTKYLMPDYSQNHSWGQALRDWNTGSTENPNDLSQQSNGTDSNYVTEILQDHCMGQD